MIKKSVHPEYKNVSERRDVLQYTYTSVQQVLYNNRKAKKDKEKKDV